MTYVNPKLRGFTLIELMVGISIFSIVILAVGSFLVSENRIASRNARSVEMQRAASTTMLAVGKFIRESASTDGDLSLDESDGQVRLVNEDSEYVLYDEDQGYITHSSGLVLVDDTWEIRQFTITKNAQNGWSVCLQLRDPDTANEVILPAHFKPRKDPAPDL